MAILDFQQPDKVIMLDSTDYNGKFEFRPLEPGFGLTVGNALRRILPLVSGRLCHHVPPKVEGVEHEFSTIKGVVEDVTEIILNLKQVRFRRHIEDTDQETVSITVKGQSTFTAGDLGKFTSAFQVMNPDHGDLQHGRLCGVEPGGDHRKGTWIRACSRKQARRRPSWHHRHRQHLHAHPEREVRHRKLPCGAAHRLREAHSRIGLRWLCASQASLCRKRRRF